MQFKIKKLTLAIILSGSMTQISVAQEFSNTNDRISMQAPSSLISTDVNLVRSLSYVNYISSQSTSRIIIRFADDAALLSSSQPENSTLQESLATDDIANIQADTLHNVGRELGHDMQILRPMSGGFHVVELTQGAMMLDDIDTLANSMMQDANILSVEPDMIMEPFATPNDPRYNDQWHYYESAGGLNLPPAWDISEGDGTVVAVIDTGITNHTDLNANVLPGYDFISDIATANDGNGRDNDATDAGDWETRGECGRGPRDSSWHGTHVAGTIAAVTNNQFGVAGVAPQAKIVPIRALGKCGGFASDIADSIRWAAGLSVAGVPNNANPADVINMSLGGGRSCGNAYQSAINAAVSAGATVVVAAGNSSSNVANFTPASCNNVISVAATTRQGGRASYSNFGSLIDVAAPGGGGSNRVLSTLNTGTQRPAAESYASYQGTSMAAPHVAGAAALMKAIDGTLTPAQIESALKSTARSFPSSCNQCGSGIVDAHAALLNVQGSEPPSPTPTPTPAPGGSNFFENTTRLDIPDGTGRDSAGPLATSIIPVNRAGNAGNISVTVDIRHTYISDLVITLRGPNGATAVLHDRAGGSNDNIQTSYSVDASDINATGDWQLEIQDFWNADAGYLASWSIEF